MRDHAIVFPDSETIPLVGLSLEMGRVFIYGYQSIMRWHINSSFYVS